MLGEAEKSRTSIESKYHLAKFVLSGQPFDKGANPFQTFCIIDRCSKPDRSREASSRLLKKSELL
jgi:hypothetical protein